MTPPTEPLLEISDLQVTFTTDNGATAAVRGANLTVFPGQTVALVGESGSGKTTMGNAAIGLLPGHAKINGGSLRFDGRELVGLPRKEWRTLRGRSIGLVPQDPMVSLNPLVPIGAQVAEVFEIHRISSGTDARKRAIQSLAEAGLPDPERRAQQFPHELSGGMRQRVLIAIALAADPRLVIADEPTSALDVTVQRHILDHLEKLAAERGTAILLITHDLGVAADRASQLVVLSKGKVVEAGPTREILAPPQHSYTKKLLAAAPSLTSVTNRAPHQDEALRRAQRTVLLEVRELQRSFAVPTLGGRSQKVRAVDDVSFTIEHSSAMGLVGESGSGKSTTARLVLGLDRPDAGQVRFGDQDLTGSRPAELRAMRRKIQPIFQDPYASLDPRFTIEQAICEPLRAFRVGSRASRRARAYELLDQVALPLTVRRRKPSELSGGQRQRVAIARALALHPELVVCDEPVSALDVSVQAQILTLLTDLQQQLGLSYLFISHDLAVVRQICDQVAVMRHGRIVEHGPVAQVFENPEHEYTKELLDAIPGRRYT